MKAVIALLSVMCAVLIYGVVVRPWYQGLTPMQKCFGDSECEHREDWAMIARLRASRL